VADPASNAVLSRKGATELDRWTIEHGTPGLELMERAGACIAAAIAERFDEEEVYSARRLLVLAGRGNNGGDGFVVARLLAMQGWTCSVALCHGEPRGDSEAAASLERWRDAGGSVLDRDAALRALDAEARGEDGGLDVVLDALFGIGLDRKLEPDDIALVRLMNDSGRPVVAVDLPSGLCADTGRVFGAAAAASLTVALGCAKPGLFVGEGPDHVGTLAIADIGLAAPDDANVVPVASLIDHRAVAGLLSPRRTTAHKGDGGHVLVCGGASGKSGAVLLAARAALRCGAGLVSMAVPASLAPSVDASLWEAMTLPIADDGHGEAGEHAWNAIAPGLERYATAALGPGLGLGQGAAALVRAFVESFPGTLVIDADAISLVARDETIRDAMLARAGRGMGRIVLTPHPGEMARLLSTTARSVQADRVGAARACASRYAGSIVVLKGAGTIVATDDILRFNTSGNPGMAAGGMGDVLAGAVAALAAVVPDPVAAASLAVHAHGVAADLLAERLEGPGFFASEVADTLPEALAVLRASGPS
jgi:hydroxyethylthiazole kinase-like uncharacterized protein yjeF